MKIWDCPHNPSKEVMLYRQHRTKTCDRGARWPLVAPRGCLQPLSRISHRCRFASTRLVPLPTVHQVTRIKVWSCNFKSYAYIGEEESAVAVITALLILI